MNNSQPQFSLRGTSLLLYLLISLAVACANEPVEVAVKATALIGTNTLDAARATATANAQRQCLEAVLRARVPAGAQSQGNRDHLEKTLLADPQPYLARFLVESHEIVDDGKAYAVKATGAVRADALTLGLLEIGVGDVFGVQQPRPTVLVLIRERFETRVTGTGAAEAAFVKLLQHKGIHVIHPEQRKLVELRNRLVAETQMDITNAAQATLGFQAEYLVLGEAAVTSSAPLAGTDLKSRMANVTLKLIEASSAREIATETAQANTKHLDELTGGNWALEEAVTKAGSLLLAQWEARLRQQLLSGTEVVTELHGLDDARQAETAATLFKGLQHVTAVAQRFYHAGVAQYEITYQSGTPALAGQIKTLTLDNQPLTVIEQSARYLRLQRGTAGMKSRFDVLELFRKFAAEKYKSFDLEQARQRDKELLRQTAELAKDQRLSDQQRKELHAARQQVEAREKEVYYRQQEIQIREQQLNLRKQALEEAAQALQARQIQIESQSQAAQTAAARALRQAEARYQEATQAAYVAAQNYQSATSNASESLATATHDVEHLIRLRDGLANFIGLPLRGLLNP